MSRGLDWSPLGWSDDPVPGDPYDVARAGRHYQDVARAIESAASRLRRLAADGDDDSDAVDALRENCQRVADDIDRAQERYAGVGLALSAYADGLDSAQHTSVRALDQAARAEDAHRSASLAHDNAPDEDVAGRAASRARMDHADAERAAAQRLLAEAIGTRDSAARTAVARIDDVKDSGDLNDSWWDDWGRKVVAVVQKVASVVATVCAVIAVAAAFIPVLGTAVAAVLGTVALIATALSMVANTALASTEYGDWGSVAWDAVGLATFGVGRAATASLRGGVKVMQGASRLQAGSLAARSGGTSVRGLMGGHSLASVRRPAARAVLKSGRSGSAFTLRNLVTAQRGVGGEFAAGWRTLRATGWDDVGRLTRDGATAVRTAPWSQKLPLVLGMDEVGQAQRFTSQMDDVLLRTDGAVEASQLMRARMVGVIGIGVADLGQTVKGAFETPSSLGTDAQVLPGLR